MTAPLVRNKSVVGAVDIGGTKIGVAAVSLTGEVLASAECATQGAGRQGTLDKVFELLRACERDTACSLAGIGIGCTGPVDPVSGVVGDVALLPGWEGLNLTKAFAEEFGVTVALENDADAAALAESEWGAGRHASRFIYVTVSTGIGAGLVFDKQLYRGANGVHPELGHHTLDDSGPVCYCGARGCWESLASGPALVSWVKGKGKGYVTPSGGGELSALDVCDLARAGDSLALEAVERLGHYLGVGLGNLMTLFCPEVIALGGGVMRSAPLFLDRACSVAQSRCGLVPSSNISITAAELGQNAALLGAAMVWQHRFRTLPEWERAEVHS